MFRFTIEGRVLQRSFHASGMMFLDLAGPDLLPTYHLRARVVDRALSTDVSQWLRLDQIVRVRGHVERAFNDPHAYLDDRLLIHIADSVGYVAPYWPPEKRS